MTKHENTDNTKGGNDEKKIAPKWLKIAMAGALLAGGAAGLSSCKSDEPSRINDLSGLAPIEQPEIGESDSSTNGAQEIDQSTNSASETQTTEASFIGDAKAAAESRGWRDA
jgi:hypothetical protein